MACSESCDLSGPLEAPLELTDEDIAECNEMEDSFHKSQSAVTENDHVDDEIDDLTDADVVQATLEAESSLWREEKENILEKWSLAKKEKSSMAEKDLDVLRERCNSFRTTVAESNKTILQLRRQAKADVVAKSAAERDLLRKYANLKRANQKKAELIECLQDELADLEPGVPEEQEPSRRPPRRQRSEKPRERRGRYGLRKTPPR